jgi:serine phosphatase RsbU (regulator of sigma subunit)
VIRETLSRVGVRGVALYLSDYDGRLLRPVPGSGGSDHSAKAVEVSTSPQGRSFRTRKLVESRDGSGVVWVPVTERADPCGVLELEFSTLDAERRRIAEDVALVVGYLLVTARKYTDMYELLRRRRHMNLAAEMHWDILPAMNYVGPALIVSGYLEPAYEIGGDAFDYALKGGVLDLSILDAMGHGLEAALLSSQTVSAYRYARRRQHGLRETALTIEQTLVRQFGGEKFVTGVLAHFDTSTAGFCWTNLGHAAPLLVRAGKVEAELGGHRHAPMGLDLLEDVDVQETSLKEGDRLMLYSDGVIDARSETGDYLRLERLVDSIEELSRNDPRPDQLVRGLIDKIVGHSGGPLRDDATIVVVEFRDGREAQRARGEGARR